MSCAKVIIMIFRPIYTDSTLQELTEHGKEDFPLSMDRQCVANEHCKYVLHWHYEVQIGVVTKGSVVFRSPEHECRILEGEGVFINSGCLHEAEPTDDSEGEYVCVNFDPKVISGYSSSLVRREYIDPLLLSDRLQIVFLKQEPWHKEICSALLEMARIMDEHSYGHELELKVIISKIWLIIVKNNEEILKDVSRISRADKQRMKTLLEYISENYTEKITLENIAESAHISKGECCRIFSRILRTTPFRYLTGYRISKSIKLLTTADMSISEIAQRTGFGNSSYFTVCFKKELGITPKEYRKDTSPSNHS